MCRKLFQAYVCGHCSFPYLMKCPLAGIDSSFPACAYPAEIPHHVGHFCHPCARAVHNQTVFRLGNDVRKPSGKHGVGQQGNDILRFARSEESGVGSGKGSGHEAAVQTHGSSKGHGADATQYSNGGENWLRDEVGLGMSYLNQGRGGPLRRGGQRGGRGNSRRGQSSVDRSNKHRTNAFAAEDRRTTDNLRAYTSLHGSIDGYQTSNHHTTTDGTPINEGCSSESSGGSLDTYSYSTRNGIVNKLDTNNSNLPSMRGLRPDGSFHVVRPGIRYSRLDPRQEWEAHTLNAAQQYTGFSALYQDDPGDRDQEIIDGRHTFNSRVAQFNAHFAAYADSGVPAQGYGQPREVGRAAGFPIGDVEILQIRRDMKPCVGNLAGAIWHTHPSMQMSGEWMPTPQEDWSDAMRGTEQDQGWDYVGYYLKDGEQNVGSPQSAVMSSQGGVDGADEGDDAKKAHDGDNDSNERRSALFTQKSDTAAGRKIRSASQPTERVVSTLDRRSGN